MSSLLIIEDDELLRDGLCAQLALAGHGVTAAADGEVAQALLESQRFDGIVLDLGLPKISGMVLLRWVRKRLPALPVLILTARDGVDDRVNGLNAGADDYLTKPFEMAELQARLASLLRRARLPAFGGSLEMASSHTARGLRVDAHLPHAWLGDEELHSIETSSDFSDRGARGKQSLSKQPTSGRCTGLVEMGQQGSFVAFPLAAHGPYELEMELRGLVEQQRFPQLVVHQALDWQVSSRLTRFGQHQTAGRSSAGQT